MTAALITETARREATARMHEHERAAVEAKLRGDVELACREAWLAEELADVLCR